MLDEKICPAKLKGYSITQKKSGSLPFSVVE